MEQEDNIELRKLILAEGRFEHESEMQKLEFKIKERESEKKTRTFFSPYATAFIGLISAVCGASVTGYFAFSGSTEVASTQANNSITLEEKKFETELILNALQAKTETQAIVALKFYADAGLIPSYSQTIEKLVGSGNMSPVPYGYPGAGLYGGGGIGLSGLGGLGGLGGYGYPGASYCNIGNNFCGTQPPQAVPSKTNSNVH